MNNKLGKPLFILSERTHLGGHKTVFVCHSEINLYSKVRKIYGLNNNDIETLKVYGHFGLLNYTIEVEKVYINLVYPALSDESKKYVEKRITESDY